MRNTVTEIDQSVATIKHNVAKSLARREYEKSVLAPRKAAWETLLGRLATVPMEWVSLSTERHAESVVASWFVAGEDPERLGNTQAAVVTVSVPRWSVGDAAWDYLSHITRRDERSFGDSPEDRELSLGAGALVLKAAHQFLDPDREWFVGMPTVTPRVLTWPTADGQFDSMRSGHQVVVADREPFGLSSYWYTRGDLQRLGHGFPDIGDSAEDRLRAMRERLGIGQPDPNLEAVQRTADVLGSIAMAQ